MTNKNDVGSVEINGDTKTVEHWYPRTGDNPKFIEIELMDVRAADNLRVSYDYKRDGWVIEQQQSKISGICSDKGEWKEMYFAEAWALEEEESYD
jgi:hypothetical protein